MNYSRSFWFNFLPFYHMGARAHYQVNDQFCSELLDHQWHAADRAVQLATKTNYLVLLFNPRKTINWTVNYYLGQEHPDFQFVTNGPPSLPTHTRDAIRADPESTERQTEYF